VLPLGISARPRKLLPTWDSYLIPLPFARAVFVVGEPLYVPADADEREKARLTEELERRITNCERAAEEMLGLCYPGEHPVS
jgi:hypothetical protein